MYTKSYHGKCLSCYSVAVSTIDQTTTSSCSFNSKHPSWIAFLEGIDTNKKYRDRINEWMDFHNNNTSTSSTPDYCDQALLQSLLQFFTFKQQELVVDNKTQESKKRYAPSFFLSMYSIFKQYWKHMGRGDLGMVFPILDTKITQCEKGYEGKSAPAFEKHELCKFVQCVYRFSWYLHKIKMTITFSFIFNNKCMIQWYFMKDLILQKISRRKCIYW